MDKPNSVRSPRGKYIISKALYLGIKKLSKYVEVFTKDEEAKKDLRDMKDLYQNMYNTYIAIPDWGEEKQLPITVTEHVHK